MKHILGILFAVSAAVLWSFFSLLTKQIYILSDISPYDMVYFRCLLPLVFTLIYAHIAGIDILAIRREISTEMFYRALIWAFIVTLNFISMKIMILSRYMILLSTGPMMTSIMGYFALHERLSIFDGISCIASFIGVVLVAMNPHAGGSGLTKEPGWAFILPLVSAFTGSIGDLLQRKYSAKIHFAAAQAWLYAATMCVVPFVSLGVHGYCQTSFAGFSLKTLIYLMMFGVVGFVAITCYILSLKYEKAGRVAAISYLQILNIIAIDAFYFDIAIDGRDILAASLIVGCSFTITLLKAFEIIS